MTRAVTTSLLFLSGATGLVYELVWSKHLANLLGNSGQAHVVVLTCFMGGLALGAYVLGRAADGAKSPLRLYGLLELGVGLYALAFPWVLGLAGSLYLALAPHVPESYRLFPKLALAGSTLLVPTLLMGGTLPALVRHFTTELGSMRRQLSRLYAVNSLGAATGVLLAGVSLVPALGLLATSRLAAVLNLALAGVALLLAKSNATVASSAPSTAVLEYPRSAVRAALVGTALAGFTSMLYEVLWIRLLAIILGGSTYAFTLILTAFISGIGLGSLWLQRRKEDGDALRLFGQLQLGLLVSVCLALPLYVRLPYYFWGAHHALKHTVETWPLYQLLTFSFCCAVLLLPAFFLGASFPSAARVATAKVAELGRQLGGVYLWNTLGTVAGSALGGLVFLPLLGLEASFALGAACNLGAGALALANAPSLSNQRIRILAPVGATLALSLVSFGLNSGWSRFVSNADAFRQRGEPFDSFTEYRTAVDESFELQFQKDDAIASVVVGQGRHNRRRYLRINGKVDASNGPDVETQVLAGHLGVLLHKREVKNVLLVGAGAAITAGSLLAHDVERVDLVEISPAVLEAARHFAEDNGHALDDPRLHAHVDDAKTFMALSPVQYDLVVSVPSNPWVAGVSGLFTREFFHTVAEHLAPDGLVVQWVHTYESDVELIRLVLRTFRDTFPHATSWLGPEDLLFVGGRQPLELDHGVLTERMKKPRVRGDLLRVDAAEPESLLARQLHSEEGQGAFVAEGRVNTDDQNHLEYEAPVAFYLGRPPAPLPDERRDPQARQRLELRRYLEAHPLSAQSIEWIHRALVRHPEGNAPLLRAVAERWLELSPDRLEARVALGRIAFLQDDLGAAHEALAPAIQAGELDAELVAAWVRVQTRRLRMARTVFNPMEAPVALLLEAERKSPGHPSLKRARDEACGLFPGLKCAEGTAP